MRGAAGEATRLAALERILGYLSLSDELEFRFEELPSEEQIKFCSLPLAYFNRCEPFSHVDELMGLPATYERVFIQGVTPRDVTPEEWDVAILTNRIIDDHDPIWKDKKAVYATARIRRVPLSEIRGMFKFQSGIVVEPSSAIIYSDGTYTSSRYYAESRKGAWYVIGQPYPVQPELVPGDDGVSIETSLMVAFSRHFEWQVEVGYQGMPTVALTVDAPSAKTIFKFRDMAPGKERREAMRHWVSEHYRASGSSDSTEELIKIWPYLRGGNEFNWHGMHCRIHPSSHDLIRAKKYDEYREIQRAQRGEKKKKRRHK